MPSSSISLSLFTCFSSISQSPKNLTPVNQKTKMTSIPFELIEDILKRLPVKSLKRFRCVARTWCLLIDSEKFIKLHLKWSLSNNSHFHLILGGLGVYSIDLDYPDKTHLVKPPFYYKSVESISNSCNGIVLIMRDPPVLWNPFTSDYKILPLPLACSAGDEEKTAPLNSFSKTVYGFGYDNISDDYKVLRVIEYRHETLHVWLSSRTEIYSLKSNKWPEIEGLKYPLPFLRGNWRAQVNGALHTLVAVEEEDGSLRAKIMAFCVGTESHREVELPLGIKSSEWNELALDMLGGCLVLVNPSGSRIVVWVMQEYGVKESWKRFFMIGEPDVERGDTLRTLVYSKDGNKVLLNIDDKKLIWFDLKRKSVENLHVDGMPFVFYAEECVESLVSLSGTVEVKKPVYEVKKGKKKVTVKNRRDDFLSEGFKLVL